MEARSGTPSVTSQQAGSVTGPREVAQCPAGSRPRGAGADTPTGRGSDVLDDPAAAKALGGPLPRPGRSGGAGSSGTPASPRRSATTSGMTNRRAVGAMAPAVCCATNGGGSDRCAAAIVRVLCSRANNASDVHARVGGRSVKLTSANRPGAAPEPWRSGTRPKGRGGASKEGCRRVRTRMESGAGARHAAGRQQRPRPAGLAISRDRHGASRAAHSRPLAKALARVIPKRAKPGGAASAPR